VIGNESIWETVADKKLKQLETARKNTKVSLATLIVPYQPRLALRSLSEENGVSRAKGTMLPVVS
jgi:hypothetical protein